MTAGVTGVPVEALATLRRHLAALPAGIPNAARWCNRQLNSMRSAARRCIACYAATVARRTRIALIVAVPRRCRRPRLSAGARSSPP